MTSIPQILLVENTGMNSPTCPRLYKYVSAASPCYRWNVSNRCHSIGRETIKRRVFETPTSINQPAIFSFVRPKLVPIILASEAAGRNGFCVFLQWAEGQSGGHGFLRHNAAPLMQWRCIVQGKIDCEIPSSQLPSSWAQIPSAVYLRANRYHCSWTGGS